MEPSEQASAPKRSKMPMINMILMAVASSLMLWNIIYRQMQPSEEEVQQRMQDDLKAMQTEEQIREAEKQWPMFNDNSSEQK